MKGPRRDSANQSVGPKANDATSAWSSHALVTCEDGHGLTFSQPARRPRHFDSVVFVMPPNRGGGRRGSQMGLPGAYGATAASKMKKLGHKRREVHNRQGVEGRGFPPSPERPTSWRTFLKAHAGVIAATDFFTVDVWTVRGLVTHYVLFVIHHASRLVEIAGVTTSPDAAFMAQVARNLTDPGEGFLRDKRCLILDRDTKFTAQFRHILEEAGVRVVNTSVQAPNIEFDLRTLRAIDQERVP
jgi:hypothetical protein